MTEGLGVEIDALLETLDHGRDSWIHGGLDAPSGGLLVQGEDQLILGPFGGEGIVGGTSLEPLQAQVAAQFHGGTGSCEVLKTIVAGDVLVVVMIERSYVKFDGYEDLQPWVLRSTQVFRRDGDHWIRLLRHADPLATFRPLADTLTMLHEP